MTTREKISKHKAVEQYWEDSDGHWVILKDGFTNYDGASGIREDTITLLYQSLSQVRLNK